MIFGRVARPFRIFRELLRVARSFARFAKGRDTAFGGTSQGRFDLADCRDVSGVDCRGQSGTFRVEICRDGGLSSLLVRDSRRVAAVQSGRMLDWLAPPFAQNTKEQGTPG